MNEYYMKLALEEAKKAYCKSEVPVGCVIVLNNKIIARGHNLRQRKKDITKHAELIAIKKASRFMNDWRLNGASMYVTLFPCPMCASAISQSRIKKVYVGSPTKDDVNYEIVKKIFEGNDYSPSVMLEENILKEECIKLLSDFFEEKR